MKPHRVPPHGRHSAGTQNLRLSETGSVRLGAQSVREKSQKQMMIIQCWESLLFLKRDFKNFTENSTVNVASGQTFIRWIFAL